jgi:hypothetical protein
MKKLSLLFSLGISIFVIWHNTSFGLSTLAKNDPYPLFSTSYPYSCLLANTKNYLKECCCEDEYSFSCGGWGYERHGNCRASNYFVRHGECSPCPDPLYTSCKQPPIYDPCYYTPSHFSAAFTGFYQKSNIGRNYDREKRFLGDLEGGWHMLGMLYGPVPSLCGTPTTLDDTQLGIAKVQLFGNFLEPIDNPNAPVPADHILVDCRELIGTFSVPIKYRKHGVRFETCFQFHEDIGFIIQGGYADIKQTLTDFINREQCPLSEEETTYIQDCTNFTPDIVKEINSLLMSCTSANRIFREQGILKRDNVFNVCDFREGAFEDLRFGVWLRHIFEVNDEFNCEWPHFLFIPYFNAEASIALGGQKNRMNALAVPFGNDGHSSVGFTAGFHIDFIETVEVGFNGGITHFFGRNVKNYRLPTHDTQVGVFPFSTNVHLKPGNNHHFSVMLHAYRFVGKLSAHADFTFVNHSEDSISIKEEDFFKPGEPDFNEMVKRDCRYFRVGQQECLTKFTSSFLTTAANYEISPNLSLGFAVQWPIQQRNAYRSTTVLGTIKGVF